MLDIHFIQDNSERIACAIRDKGISDVSVEAVLKLDSERRGLITRIEALNRQRKDIAKRISMLPAGDEQASLKEEGRTLKESLGQLESKSKTVDNGLRGLLLRIPNIYPDDTPVALSEEGNVEVRRWGTPRISDTQAPDHAEIGERLDIIDFERGAKVSGFRGYYLKNEGAELAWAVLSLAIDTIKSNGFTFMIPPTLVRELALTGSGHFPTLREESYPADDRYLVGTSEPSLLAYHADEILPFSKLPLKFCAVSPCYRREIGSYGKDARGLYRVHEFFKVEQVVLCDDSLEHSLKLFEDMLSTSEALLRELELPYRVLRICTGDMGAGKYKMYDIETWMPSRNAYGETHSCSHLTDWQARRLNLRYRNAEGKICYPHTMNNTVIASPRILIAILENNMQADGSVSIPKVLVPYMGGRTKIARP